MNPVSDGQPRYLIVNADDFGQSAGVNQGVISAHEHGIVTSASLMVRWPAAAAAGAYAQAHPELSVGLHLELCEWTRRGETWSALYEVVSLDDRDAVAAEADHQLALFKRLVGRDPTHLDSHQHVHRSEPVRSVATAMAGRLGVPLRECDDRVRYSGAFYGQSGDGYPYPDAIRPEGLIKTLETLPLGVTELGCHPGDGSEMESMYGPAERTREVETLCDPRVSDVLTAEGIALCSFASLPAARPAAEGAVSNAPDQSGRPPDTGVALTPETSTDTHPCRRRTLRGGPRRNIRGWRHHRVST